MMPQTMHPVPMQMPMSMPVQSPMFSSAPAPLPRPMHSNEWQANEWQFRARPPVTVYRPTPSPHENPALHGPNPDRRYTAQLEAPHIDTQPWSAPAVETYV